MLLTLGISIGLTILGLTLRNSKICSLLFLLWIWLLWGWNFENGDYDAYRVLYNNVLNLTSFDYEPGYKLLMLVGHIFEFSFQEFLQFLSLIIVILWGHFVFKLSKNPALFVCTLFWIYFPLDYVLLRNSLAFAIVMQGLISLLKESRWSYLKFILTVIIASTIHSSAFFYILFLFIPIINKLSKTTLVLLVFLTCISLILLKGYLTSYLFDETEGRTEDYATSLPLFVLYSIFDISNYLFIKSFYISSKKRGSDTQIFSKILDYNIILLLLIPFFLIAGIVIRLLRNISILNILAVENYLTTNRTKQDYSFLAITYCIVIVIYFVVPVYSLSFEPLFSKNILFQ